MLGSVCVRNREKRDKGLCFGSGSVGGVWLESRSRRVGWSVFL